MKSLYEMWAVVCEAEKRLRALDTNCWQYLERFISLLFSRYAFPRQSSKEDAAWMTRAYNQIFSIAHSKVYAR